MNKNKIFAMMAGGAMLAGVFGGCVALAAQGTNERAGNPPGEHRMMPPPRISVEQMAERVSRDFGADKDEIIAYANEKNADFRDISHGAMLAKVSGKSFAEIMTMREGGENWRTIEESLGVTRKEMREAMGAAMAERIAGSDTNLSRAEVESLIKDGYHPMDIRAAGVIGKASGKSALEVLSMKKINNDWEDVAKELGVDESVLKEAFRRRDDRMGPGHEGGRGPGGSGDRMGPPMRAPGDGGSPEGEAPEAGQ